MTTGLKPKQVDDGFGLIILADFVIDITSTKKVRVKTGARKGMRPKSDTRDFDTFKPDKIGGERAWRCLRESHVSQFRNQPGFLSYNRTGVFNGTRKDEAAAITLEAKRMARIDMDNIIRTYGPEEDIVEEATLALLEIVRGPVLTEKLKAAKTLLDFYRAKPRAPVTISVDTSGDDWLTAIGANVATDDQLD